MEQQLKPGTATLPTSTIEISISCKNLLVKDFFSRSDPVCVVYTQPWARGHWEEYARTETVWDTQNPEFSTKVKIDYRFEEEQPIRFVVYDIDSKSSNNLKDQDFMGFAECTVGRIVAAGYSGVELHLNQNRDQKYSEVMSSSEWNMSIVFVAEELVDLKEEISFQFLGESMGTKVLGCCISRIFYTLSKINEAGNYIKLWKSELCSGMDPDWGELTLNLNTVCNGDKGRKLKLEFYEEGFQGYDIYIGCLYSTVNQLISIAGVKDESLPVQGEDGKPTPSRLSVILCKINPIYTFLDYIRGGTQIHCCFAIDMTESNGSPSDLRSLHYLGASEMSPTGNPYEQAILAVGEVIQDYDNTKSFPAYGFGARLPSTDIASHKFHLNLQNPSPFCYGISGVLESYRSCIRQVELCEPTKFAHVIQEVANLARENADGWHYYVLVIITDGILGDSGMDKATKAIVNASTLPLSIIIVGVGGANFDAMNTLDGDNVRLSYYGKVRARDIVQFVPFRDTYQWNSTVAPAVAAGKCSVGFEQDSTNRIAKFKLAKEVLAEVPEQLTSYMKSRGIAPMSMMSQM